MHNRGPWKYEPSTRTVRTARENYWLATVDSWDGMVAANGHDNGRLMAAAPEILEALRDLLTFGRDREDDCLTERASVAWSDAMALVRDFDLAAEVVR